VSHPDPHDWLISIPAFRLFHEACSAVPFDVDDHAVVQQAVQEGRDNDRIMKRSVLSEKALLDVIMVLAFSYRLAMNLKKRLHSSLSIGV
jgi:ribosomal protein S28E/S33